jgi:hypothetical protein
VLQTTSLWNSEVRIIAYLDDVFLQGPKGAVAAAYEDLRSEATKVGLQMQSSKCTVYSTNASHAQDSGSQLGMRVNIEGITAAGCPIWKPAFVQQEARKQAEKTVNLLNTLSSLEVSAQDQLLLLRKSLQVKISHLARCAEFEDVQEALLMVEQAIAQAMLQIIGRDASMLDMEQLLLPLRKGGLGIQCLTAAAGVVCKAGFVAAAVLTQQALSEAPESLQPFKGAAGQNLRQIWEQIGPCRN